MNRTRITGLVDYKYYSMIKLTIIITISLLCYSNAIAEFPYCEDAIKIEKGCEERGLLLITCLSQQEMKEYKRYKKTCEYYTPTPVTNNKTKTTQQKKTKTQVKTVDHSLTGKHIFGDWFVWVKKDPMTDKLDAFMQSDKVDGVYIQLSTVDSSTILLSAKWNNIMNARLDYRIDKNPMYSPDNLYTYQDHKAVGVSIPHNGTEILEMKNGNKIMIRGLKFQSGFTITTFSLNGFTKAYKYMITIK